MTRREWLVAVGKFSAVLVLVAVGLPAGCGGGSSNETGSQVTLTPERKAELEKQQKATEEFYAKQKKK